MRDGLRTPLMGHYALSSAASISLKLLGAGATLLHVDHLTTTVDTAIRADVMREAHLAAVRAYGKLGKLHLVMRAAISLARVGLSFLR